MQTDRGIVGIMDVIFPDNKATVLTKVVVAEGFQYTDRIFRESHPDILKLATDNPHHVTCYFEDY